MYIVKATSKAFIKVTNDEFVITSNENNATKYEKIGDAMRIASIANKLLGSKIIHAIWYNYKTK